MSKSTNRIRGLAAGLALCGLAGLTSAQTPWMDDFDSYALGSNIKGQGGWNEWDNLPGGDSVVSNAFARSAPHSLEVKLTSDAIHPFSGVTSGRWVITAHQYLPSSLFEETDFLVLSRYQHSAPINYNYWTVWMEFNMPSPGSFTSYVGANGTTINPMVFDQWVEIRVEVDLDADLVEVFYNDVAVGPPYQWTAGWNGSVTLGPKEIATIDLFSPTTMASQAAYYDDVSLKPLAPLPTFFCTAKTGLVCGVPAIQASGTSSATNTAANPFTVTAAPARSCKSGILIYNTAQIASPVPFQGGTLCVEPMGLRRAGSTNSMGTPGGASCDGAFAIDMNAFGVNAWVVPNCDGTPSGTPPNNAAGFLTVPGTPVFAQLWGRDSVASGSYVSDGVSWDIAP